MQNVATGIANCAIVSGVPRKNIFPNNFPDNLVFLTRNVPFLRKKWKRIISKDTVCEIPVARAAPEIPICKGNTNSQSRKILRHELTIVSTITSIGDPSFLTKNCKSIETADGKINAEYQIR